MTANVSIQDNDFTLLQFSYTLDEEVPVSSLYASAPGITLPNGETLEAIGITFCIRDRDGVLHNVIRNTSEAPQYPKEVEQQQRLITFEE